MINGVRNWSLSLGLLSIAVPMAAHALTAVPEVALSTGAVYIASNGVIQNEVYAYHRASDGTLTYIGGYITGGRGSGGTVDPLQSQNSLLLSDDHNWLFVVNSGSGNVSSFKIEPTGLLSLVDIEPSHGGFPNGLATQGKLLYVLNEGGDGSVSGFDIESNGHIDSIPYSTRLLSGTGAGGSSIDISPDGRFVACAERLTNTIDIFPIGFEGRLGSLVSTVSQGAVPFGLTFTPQGALVVNEAGGGPNGTSAESSYTVESTGTLDPVTTSLSAGLDAACWIVTSPDGNYVYIADSASSKISTDSVANDGALTNISATSSGAGTIPIDLALSTNGRYLYALTIGSGMVSAFQTMPNGSLNPIGTAKGLPATSGQNGIAAF